MAATIRGASQVIARRGGALALVGLLSAFVAGCGENAAAHARGRRPGRQPGSAGRQMGLRRLSQGRGSGADHERGGGAVQSALCHRQRAERRRDDEPGRPEGIVRIGPERPDRTARPSLDRPATPARPTTASSAMSMRIRSRRFGSIRTTQVAMARRFTCGAESANQRLNLELALHFQSTECSMTSSSRFVAAGCARRGARGFHWARAPERRPPARTR